MMAANPLCVQQDVEDLLGVLTSSKESFIKVGGIFEPARVARLILRKSAIMVDAHGNMQFAETEITEYYDIVSIPRVVTRYTPLISVTELALFTTGSTYEVKSEGQDRNTDDFYIEGLEAGVIGFWNKPANGLRRVRLKYKYGYASGDVPEYVADCCSKMVAADLAMDRNFQAECKDDAKRWDAIVKIWMEDYETLLNDHIRLTRFAPKSIGLYYNPTVTQELAEMTDNHHKCNRS